MPPKVPFSDAIKQTSSMGTFAEKDKEAEEFNKLRAEVAKMKAPKKQKERREVVKSITTQFSQEELYQLKVLKDALCKRFNLYSMSDAGVIRYVIENFDATSESHRSPKEGDQG